MKYVVVYVGDGMKDQILTNPLNFEDANDMAALLTADLVADDNFEGNDCGYYTVSPYLK